MKIEDYKKEAIKRYGKDNRKWKFRCPRCNTVIQADEWIKAGDKGGMIGFSCIGRLVDNKGCNYAGGGLFRINPIVIELEEGETVELFDFADDPLIKNKEEVLF